MHGEAVCLGDIVRYSAAGVIARPVDEWRVLFPTGGRLKGTTEFMWPWFFGGYAVFVAFLVGYSAHVALSRDDERHRADAFRVLKLIWSSVLGAGGLAALALRAHEIGLL